MYSFYIMLITVSSGHVQRGAHFTLFSDNKRTLLLHQGKQSIPPSRAYLTNGSGGSRRARGFGEHEVGPTRFLSETLI